MTTRPLCQHDSNAFSRITTRRNRSADSDVSLARHPITEVVTRDCPRGCLKPRTAPAEQRCRNRRNSGRSQNSHAGCLLAGFSTLATFAPPSTDTISGL